MARQPLGLAERTSLTAGPEARPSDLCTEARMHLDRSAASQRRCAAALPRRRPRPRPRAAASPGVPATVPPRASCRARARAPRPRAPRHAVATRPSAGWRRRRHTAYRTRTSPFAGMGSTRRARNSSAPNRCTPRLRALARIRHPLDLGALGVVAQPRLRHRRAVRRAPPGSIRGPPRALNPECGPLSIAAAASASSQPWRTNSASTARRHASVSTAASCTEIATKLPSRRNAPRHAPVRCRSSSSPGLRVDTRAAR